MGGEAERRLHFRHGPPPPQGKGDAVSQVWALSPPGTTDWAAFGRRVSGAWSVAWSPPLPRRTTLLPKALARGALHQTVDCWTLSPRFAPLEHTWVQA